MKKLKNYKAFLESYGTDVQKFIDNDKEFALIKGDDFIIGFDTISEVLEHLTDILLQEKQISVDEKSEFMSVVSEKIEDINVDQYLIDTILEQLLDRFNIIEPFHIKQKSELEETPIDNSLDDMSDTEEIQAFLSESKK